MCVRGHTAAAVPRSDQMRNNRREVSVEDGNTCLVQAYMVTKGLAYRNRAIIRTGSTVGSDCTNRYTSQCYPTPYSIRKVPESEQSCGPKTKIPSKARTGSSLF